MTDDELIEQITIAAPCAADWNAMGSDDRVRFCASCEKHVYNLAAMPAHEAAALIRARDGKLCVRILARNEHVGVAPEPRQTAKFGQIHIRFLMAIIAGVGAALGVTKAWWWGEETQSASGGGRSSCSVVLGCPAIPPSLLPPPGSGATGGMPVMGEPEAIPGFPVPASANGAAKGAQP